MSLAVFLTNVIVLSSAGRCSCWQECCCLTVLGPVSKHVCHFSYSLFHHWKNRKLSRPFLITFLTCCEIIPTSFGGKGPHLGQWLMAQLLHRTVSGLFLSYNANARRSVHNPQDYFIITLSATEMTDVTLGARGLWLGTPTGWHHQISLKFFVCSPRLHRQQSIGFVIFWEWIASFMMPL